MDPGPYRFLGRVQGFKHGIRDANSDSNVGLGKGLEDKWVSIKELDFCDVVGLHKLHHLRWWQWVRGCGAPVHLWLEPQSLSPSKLKLKGG
ncbi:hypothetical protein ACOSP7_024625 [Xanthoceras sorbifolium]